MNILDFLFPRRCLSCGKIGKYFCNGCVGKIRIIEQRETICPICEQPAISGATHPFCKTRYTIDGLTSFFHYDRAIPKAVKAVKYRFVSDIASEFVSLIPQAFYSDLTKVLNLKPQSSFIPIPLHSTRLRHRGFNQAETLGMLIAERLNISLRTDVLKRIRSTIPQVEMKDRKERLQNMENVFCVLLSAKSSMPSTVLLFDDVFTTGATMCTAAGVLKRAGVGFVWGVTLAR